MFIISKINKGKFNVLVSNAYEMAKSEFQDKLNIFVYPLEVPFEDFDKYQHKNKVGIVISLNFEPSLMDPLLKNCPNIFWIHGLGTGVEKLLECPLLANNDKITLTNSH